MQTITSFFQKTAKLSFIIHNYSVPLHLLSRLYKSMNNKISHSGVVESVEGDCVHVRIVQASACAACKVAGYCNSAESKEKIVDVYCGSASQRYVAGQGVTVTASTHVAAHALLMGFGLPFVVLVSVLVAVLALSGDEGLAALSGLLALLPYYGVLYLLRERVRQQLAFSIE